MSNIFGSRGSGPWTTKFESGAMPRLNTFWNRRLHSLPITQRAVPALSRRSAIGLAVLALFTCGAPTIYVSPAPAAPAAATTAEPAAAAAPAKPSPVRLELPEIGVWELIAVGEHPSRQNSWWAADGSPAAAPYHEFASRVTTPGELVREFAIRWQPTTGSTANVYWNVKGGGSSAAGDCKDADGQRIPSLRAMANAFPNHLQECTFVVSVASGEWRTVAETDGATTFSAGGPKYTFAFGPLTRQDETLVLTVSHNDLGENIRVIAVDKQGGTLAVAATYAAGGRGFMQEIARFKDLQLAEVHEFQVQARAFTRYEVRGISLDPAHRTTPRIAPLETEQAHADVRDAIFRQRMQLLENWDYPRIPVQRLNDIE